MSGSTGFENKSRPTPCLLSKEGVIHTPPPLCRQTTTGAAMVPRVLWCLLGCALGGFPSARAITSTSTSDITSDPSCVTVQVSAMFLMCAVDNTRMLAALGDKGGWAYASFPFAVGDAHATASVVTTSLVQQQQWRTYLWTRVVCCWTAAVDQRHQRQTDR